MSRQKTEKKNKTKDRVTRRQIFQNVFFLLKVVSKATPDFPIVVIAQGILRGGMHAFVVVTFVQLLFNMIERSEPFAHVVALVVLGILLEAIAGVIGVWYNSYYFHMAKQRLHKKMQSDLFRKAMALDLQCYDTPQFYDDFIWTTKEAEQRGEGIMYDLGSFADAVTFIAVALGTLAFIDYRMLIMIPASFVVIVWMDTANTKLHYKQTNAINPLQKRSDYIDRVFYLPDHTKELRMSDMESVLQKELNRTVTQMKKLLLQYGRKIFRNNVFSGMTRTIVLDVGILVLLAYRVMVEQDIALGDFATSVNGSVWIIGNFSWLLGIITQFTRHGVYGEKLRTFLERESFVVNKPEAVCYENVPHSIELKHVSFTYAENEVPALQDVSLRIEKGEKVAIVGYNGAGKTTLIKLLMRLYDTTEGEIWIGDRNIKEYELESFRSSFGTVFQDYKIFAASIAQNVVMAQEYESDEAILQALEKSGFRMRLANMKDGIETHLTREFNEEGVILSGGEYQKIAIARIFVKQYSTVILDEPSSALDPIAEYELNQTIMGEERDKTVIMISHRLATTRMADRIFMLERGRIIEQGSHAELMALDGKYAQMFEMQRKKYQTVDGGG